MANIDFSVWPEEKLLSIVRFKEQHRGIFINLPEECLTGDQEEEDSIAESLFQYFLRTQRIFKDSSLNFLKKLCFFHYVAIMKAHNEQWFEKNFDSLNPVARKAFLKDYAEFESWPEFKEEDNMS